MPQLFAMIESYKNTLAEDDKDALGLQPSFCYMLGQEKSRRNSTRDVNETIAVNVAVSCVPVSDVPSPYVLEVLSRYER